MTLQFDRVYLIYTHAAPREHRLHGLQVARLLPSSEVSSNRNQEANQSDATNAVDTKAAAAGLSLAALNGRKEKNKLLNLCSEIVRAKLAATHDSLGDAVGSRQKRLQKKSTCSCRLSAPWKAPRGEKKKASHRSEKHPGNPKPSAPGGTSQSEETSVLSVYFT